MSPKAHQNSELNQS